MDFADHTVFPMIFAGDEQVAKLNHDRYEVYVNGDFVGFKTLMAQNEEIDDLNDFLTEHGFHTFSTDCEGDHYDISAVANVSEMKDVLNIYLRMD